MKRGWWSAEKLLVGRPDTLVNEYCNMYNTRSLRSRVGRWIFLRRFAGRRQNITRLLRLYWRGPNGAGIRGPLKEEIID